MSPVRYSTVLGDKSKESRFQLRLELVRYVQKQGLREVARFFCCSRNTVRLWVRRYGVQGFSGLQERTRAPRRIPHKTSLYLEQRVVKARKRVPCCGAFRFKQMFALTPSVEAIRRTLRGRGLTPGPGSSIRRSWICGR
ncbi:MAG: helix-turn-helix domain-containing protein [Thermodesulfobacteriota bacterium]